MYCAQLGGGRLQHPNSGQSSLHSAEDSERYPPRPMAIAPAATSASPAVTMTWLEVTAAARPAANAKGAVSPSAMPITTSLTDSEPVK